jgi:tRNA nucleotidyltransferase (CCA-adding enzyme)
VWDETSKRNLQKLDNPESAPLVGLKLNLQHGNNRRRLAYILWVIHLPVDKIQALIRRLRFPSTYSKLVFTASHLWRDVPWFANAKLSQIATRLEDIPPLAVYAVYLAAPNELVRNNLQAYINRMSSIAPTITGDELKKMGIPPGPVYKRILGAIRDGWLDGKIGNGDQEQAYLNEIIKNETVIHPPSH